MAQPYRYVGEDGSLGLRKDVVYMLELEQIDLTGKFMMSIPTSQFRREHNTGLLMCCPYKSWDQFNQYWRKI